MQAQRSGVRSFRGQSAFRPQGLARPVFSVRAAAEAAEAKAFPAFNSAPLQTVMEKGEFYQFPASPGVYAIYCPDRNLQYIGLSRRVSMVLMELSAGALGRLSTGAHLLLHRLPRRWTRAWQTTCLSSQT